MPFLFILFIRVVTMDMSSAYRSYIEVCLPNAKIVVDKYHVFQALSTRVKKVRSRLGGVQAQSQQIGVEGNISNRTTFYAYTFEEKYYNGKSGDTTLNFR